MPGLRTAVRQPGGLGPGRSLALAGFLGAGIAALAVAWIPSGMPAYLGFQPRSPGEDIRWGQAYAKIEIPTVEWRPYRVTLRLRAPLDRDRLTVRLGAEDRPLGEVRVGPDWETHTLDVEAPATLKPGTLSLQVYSAVEPDEAGAGVEFVRARPVVASRTGLTWMLAGALVGGLVWATGPAARGVLAPVLSRAAGGWHPAAVRWLLLGVLVVVAPRLGLVFDSGTEAANRMTWLGVSLVILAGSGRVLRRTVERATASTAAGVARTPLFDLLAGALAWTIAVAAVSVLIKRGLGLETPAPFDLRWLLAAATIGGAWRLRRLDGSWRCLAPSVRDMVSAAAFLFAAGLAAGPHARGLYGYSTDVEHHIYWLGQIEQHGFVPDRYLASGVPLDYPLGFHTLAWCLGTITPLSPAVLINVAVPLGSLLLVAAIVHAVWSAIEPQRSHWLTPWLAFAALLGLGTGFDAAQFSNWLRYEGTARLAAGWVHALPIALLVDAALRRRSAIVPESDGEVRSSGGDERSNLLLALGLLPASLALSFTFNPALVPLQAMLALAAAAMVVALSRPRSPGRCARALGAGVVCGVLLLWGDPYLGGLADRRFDAATARARAEFMSHLTRETCLSPSCLADVDAASIARAAATPFVRVASPWTVLERGAFPSLTAPIEGPFHALVPILLMPVPLLFLWWARRRPVWLALVGGFMAATALDGGLREYLRQVIDPADPTLRLLPPYMDRASAVLFNQSLWSLMAAALVLAASSTARARGAVSLPGVAAGTLVSLALVPAAAGVWLAAREVQTAAFPPTEADVDALHRLEATHVPEADRYLVAAVTRDANGERWIMGNDPNSSLYALARRSPVFLYFLDAGARFAPSDLEAVCSRLEAGARPPAALVDARARWAVALSDTAAQASTLVGMKPLCGHTFDHWFPDRTLAARDGRVSLFRLW